MPVAAYVVYQAFVSEEGSPVTRLLHGVARTALVAICAGLVATQVVTTLIGTQVKGVAGMSQSPGEQTKEQKLKNWDWATQWSLPKRETLALVVPGLFGYRMDTPNLMPE